MKNLIKWQTSKIIVTAVCIMLVNDIDAIEFERFALSTDNIESSLNKSYKRQKAYENSRPNNRAKKKNQPSDYFYKQDRGSFNNDRQIRSAYRMRGKGTPQFAVKANLINTVTSTLSVGAEVRLTKNVTFNTSASWNPWTYNAEENTKFKFLLVEPEIRYWSCESFNGHFFGIHGHYAYYNVGSLPSPFSETMNQHRFEGQLAGAGISYGYHWLLSPRWSLDAEIGAGYAKLWYEKYPCLTCAKVLTNENKNYWGITRAGLSIVYLF